MEEHFPLPQSAMKQDFGKLQYGCEHYRRRCKIRAPCCDQIFTCRHCHNEAMVFPPLSLCLFLACVVC
ncbi:hypothetical protein IC582_005852 [Cucumis melo]